MSLLFDPYTILKFLHIIMAGLWLGMDFGVYASGSKTRDAKLSIETRAAFGKLSGILDMGPRSAVVIMLMLGITMTFLGGWGSADGLETQLALTAAIIGVVWLAGLWHQYWVDHPNLGETRPANHIAIGQTFRTIDIGMRVVVTSIVAAVAVWSLIGDGPIAATWLATKLVLFSLIVVCGIGIRLSLPPVRKAMGDIFANGSTPEREQELQDSRGLLVFYVKSIWVLVALIIWISVAKF